MMSQDQTNQYALITGASSGMGYHYARQLAARGYNLLMVSNQDAIYEKADTIRQNYKIQVIALLQDLGTPTAAKDLHNYCLQHNIHIDILINNAGVYHDCDFLDDTEKFNTLIINLHMLTPAMLCYYFGQDMVAQGRGYILNVSSVTAHIPVQRLATYAASKAFIESFTHSLHIELRHKGVIVTNIAPGAVDTGLYHLNSTATHIGKKLGYIVTPEYLVHRALKGLFGGKAKVSVPCIWNALLVFLIALIPTRLLLLIRKYHLF